MKKYRHNVVKFDKSYRYIYIYPYDVNTKPIQNTDFGLNRNVFVFNKKRKGFSTAL